MYIFKFFYRKTDTKKVGEVSRYTPTEYDITIKMASLLAVQRLFSAPKKIFVDPTFIAYGKSRNAKKPFILELFTKNKKNGKKLHFFTDFFI